MKKKKNNKEKDNKSKKKKIVLIIALIVFIGGLITITIIYNNNNKNREVLETEAIDVGIIKINDANYEEETKDEDKLIILEFYENMCPPCTTMIPTLINIAKTKENVKIAMINLSSSDTENLAEKYEVSATPTIVILKDGKEIKKFIGATSEETLMNVINSNGGN